MKKIIFLTAALMLILAACSGGKIPESDEAAAPAKIEETGLTEALSASGLPTSAFSVTDPGNERKLSEKKIEHSYGVSRGGVPHENSLAAQAFFDEKGYKAVCCDTKSGKKVLYLTFDCGWENGCTADILDTLREKSVPAAFFCTLDHIRSEPELIRRMIDEGHIVGNHSAHHPDFAYLSREQAAGEIMTCDNYLRENFGYSAPFFRFPEGSYNESILELTGSLGFTSVFWSAAYEDWDTDAPKGADYAFETVTARLHPGAVILLHSVSPDNRDALGDIIDFARDNGYEFRPLTEFGK